MMELATKTMTADRTMGCQRAARETMDSLLEREGEYWNSQATLRCAGVEVKARPYALDLPLLDTALLRPLSLTFAPWRSYASERASAFLRGVGGGRGGPRCSSKSKSWNSILLTLRRSTVRACSISGRIFSRAPRCMLPGAPN